MFTKALCYVIAVTSPRTPPPSKYKQISTFLYIEKSLSRYATKCIPILL